jgi:hypothetical protein
VKQQAIRHIQIPARSQGATYQCTATYLLLISAISSGRRGCPSTTLESTRAFLDSSSSMHLAECVSAATCSGVRVIWSLASTGAGATPGPPPSSSSRAHITASCLQARWRSRADISWSSALEASEPLRMRPRASFMKPSTAVSRSAVLSSTTARQKFSCFTRSMLPFVPAPPALPPEPCKLKPRNFQTLAHEQIPSILYCRSTHVAHKPPASTASCLNNRTRNQTRCQKKAEETSCFPNQCLNT